MYEQMKRNQGITSEELEARLASGDDVPTVDAEAVAASAVIKDETE